MNTNDGTAPSTPDKTPNPWSWIDGETLAHIRALIATWPEPGLSQLRAVASLRQHNRASHLTR